MPANTARGKRAVGQREIAPHAGKDQSRPMRSRLLLSLILVLAGMAGARAALPAEVTATTATKLEILRDGRAAGSIGLPTGAKLELVEVVGDFVVVRYRNLNGRVPAAHTDLPRSLLPPDPAKDAVAPPSRAASAPPPAVAPKPPYVPATALERALAGKLVRLEGNALRPQDPGRFAAVKFYAFYFSASWCGPCRQFTPELVDAYGKIRALYPEFEVVLVSRDRSQADMGDYVRSDRMTWPVLAWNAIRGHEVNRYAGSGIPCLVLVDANGKVLSDSYRWGRYVGPDAVLDDTWKILREYRRAHPKPKA